MSGSTRLSPCHLSSLFLASCLLLLACSCSRPPRTEAPPPTASAAPAAVPGSAEHAAGVETFHAERVERLRGEGGWLTLIGLDWLEPGEHRVGSAEDAAVKLPPDRAPAHLGTLRVSQDEVRFEVTPGVQATLGEVPAAGDAVIWSREVEAVVVRHGSIAFNVIERGGRLAIRTKDSLSPVRTEFRGIERYPVDPSWRVEGRLDAATATEVEVPSVIGTSSTLPSPGVVHFELQGRAFTLRPILEPGDDSLFFVFADASNGHETYGGGRFLDAALPEDGRVVLDFNLATNPPCAFTDFATCPLPPEGNRLDVAVRAGEKAYGDPAAHD